MSRPLNKPAPKRKSVHDSDESAKDNSNLKLKLELRREYINKYLPNTPLHVLETCAGEYGWIWNSLRKEFDVKKYLGFDQKPVARGIVQGDAEQLALGINVSDFNVLDIDPYGLPWKIFSNLTKNFTGKAVVFLTAGNAIDIRPLSSFERECLGIPLGWENVPCSSVLFQKTIPYCLKKTQGKCESSDVTLCWHESVVGHGVVGYVCLFLDGSKNDVSSNGAKENEEKASERNEGVE